VDRESLEFAFTPCPNDTLSFHAWISALVPGPPVAAQIADIETLNERAERGEAQLTKISVATFARVRHNYALLRAGGAAGYGVGPIVVTRTRQNVAGRIAVPGVRTTASLLLRLVGDFDTVAMPFHEIENAVLSGQVDCGVLIHEGVSLTSRKGCSWWPTSAQSGKNECAAHYRSAWLQFAAISHQRGPSTSPARSVAVWITP